MGEQIEDATVWCRYSEVYTDLDTIVGHALAWEETLMGNNRV